MKVLEYGFKNYDELVFGNNQSDISPFTNEQWNLIMKWYWRIASIIGGPILISIVVLAWKMIIAGISPDKRSEVKDNLLRLFFGASAIGIAPVFVKFMLLLNNSLVNMLVGYSHGSLDDLLGNSLLTSINTGNAIATAIVIAMFAYLFVKINVKFIIRQFTIIVFTIFTPIVAVFWIINKRTIASSIWFGQIIINAFMQFIYAFLFLIYLSFLPVDAGWAISLLWGMMILPLGDALQNTMQNLVSRMAGINNDDIANRGIGMGAAMGYTLKSIACQFKGNNLQEENTTSNKVNKIIKQSANTESTQSNFVNIDKYSKNIMEEPNCKVITSTTKDIKTNANIQNNKEMSNTVGVKKALNVGKEFMNLGMYMSEGKHFRNSNLNKPKERKLDYRNNDKSEKESKIEEHNKIVTIEMDDVND